MRSRRDRLADLEERLERLEHAQAEVLEGVAAVREELSHKGASGRRLAGTERAVQALVRHHLLDLEDVPYPQRLLAHRFGLRSQNEEDGLVVALTRAACPPVRRFAELGCGPNGGNCGVLAGELGWGGLMIDGKYINVEKVRGAFGADIYAVQALVTAENVDDLLARHGIRGDVGVLSIDVDGIDLWLWQAVTVAVPRVVVIEYNAVFGAQRSVTVPYDPGFQRDRRPGIRLFYGASLRALCRVGRRKGYRLVAVEARGTNAFFLRDDVAADIPAVEVDRAYRGADRHAYLPELEQAMAQHGVSLETVD